MLALTHIKLATPGRICLSLWLVIGLTGCVNRSWSTPLANPFAKTSDPAVNPANSQETSELTADDSSNDPPLEAEPVYQLTRDQLPDAPRWREPVPPQSQPESADLIHSASQAEGQASIIRTGNSQPVTPVVDPLTQELIPPESLEHLQEFSTPLTRKTDPANSVPELAPPPLLPPTPSSSQPPTFQPEWENSPQHNAAQTDDESVNRQPYRYFDVPIKTELEDAELEVKSVGNYLTLMARNAPLNAVLSLIAKQHGLNIVLGDDLESEVSVTLHDVPLQDALDTILSVAGCSWVQQRNVILVSKVNKESIAGPLAQDRQVMVIPLNFAAAADVEKIVSGIISPVGKVFIHEADSTDKRKTQEKIVVEDLPQYLVRVQQYVASIDIPPRQVLIEAHILRVTLDDSCRHGVNLSYLTSVAGASMAIGTQGLASPTATPSLMLTIDGSKLDNVVEAIKDTNDAKTLASPKVLVLNGQEAKIQIGEQLGYLVTTTTQTATLENVQFLDVGVVLNVVPQISNDGRILMKVKPEISSGTVNPNTGLPDKETTEVDTTVMLPDGHGIVLGGLIQETDSDRQSKIPGVGDIRYLGRAFQRRTYIKERGEIIIALTARIVPYDENYRCQDEERYHRATSPLLYGPLISAPRPEPSLFDACHRPIKFKGFDRNRTGGTEPYYGSQEYCPNCEYGQSGLTPTPDPRTSR